MTFYQKSTGTSAAAAQSRERRMRLFADAGGKCFYCGRPVIDPNIKHDRDWLLPDPERAQMVREHKVPTMRGGDNRLGNIVCGCRGCNSLKAAFTVDEFRMATGLIRGDLSFRFSGEPAVEPRDWMVCHSADHERGVLIHNLPGAAEGYRLRKSHVRRVPVRT